MRSFFQFSFWEPESALFYYKTYVNSCYGFFSSVKTSSSSGEAIELELFLLSPYFFSNYNPTCNLFCSYHSLSLLIFRVWPESYALSFVFIGFNHHSVSFSDPHTILKTVPLWKQNSLWTFIGLHFFPLKFANFIKEVLILGQRASLFYLDSINSLLSFLQISFSFKFS